MKKASFAVVAAVLASAATMIPVQQAAAWGACGPRGCAGGPGYYPGRGYDRPFYGPPRGGVVVVQPRRYYPSGGAVAAGVALGVLAGAAAVSMAGPPPRPNYCWYYTNPQHTTGFWDACPR